MPDDTPSPRGRALAASATLTLPAPSAEVRAEALARAERLAAGLFPHQVEGVAFLLGAAAARSSPTTWGSARRGRASSR